MYCNGRHHARAPPQLSMIHSFIAASCRKPPQADAEECTVLWSLPPARTRNQTDAARRGWRWIVACTDCRGDTSTAVAVGSLRLCHVVLEVTAICGCTIIFLRLPTGPLASDLH
jgi:hypothetical protein